MTLVPFAVHPADRQETEAEMRLARLAIHEAVEASGNDPVALRAALALRMRVLLGASEMLGQHMALLERG